MFWDAQTRSKREVYSTMTPTSKSKRKILKPTRSINTGIRVNKQASKRGEYLKKVRSDQ